ncbi:MAG: hypothetical protein EU981_03515 [Candidatus Liberibacter ctenarytainae]|uniref:Lipoprotein n=1 Tax=Candidatus Liberibacter ctenarytainae TaxID=2020335 RepID=A0A937DM45_9HYPH|nr:hypothetical protein [Candidatus Liberibacter ctenarytainae]
MNINKILLSTTIITYGLSSGCDLNGAANEYQQYNLEGQYNLEEEKKEETTEKSDEGQIDNAQLIEEKKEETTEKSDEGQIDNAQPMPTTDYSQLIPDNSQLIPVEDSTKTVDIAIE